MARWIDVKISRDWFWPGDVAFLIRYQPDDNRKPSIWEFSKTPILDRRTEEPRLQGFIVNYNNESIIAEGVVKISRMAAEGQRALVVDLEGQKLKEAIEKLEGEYEKHLPDAVAERFYIHESEIE